MNIDRRIRNAQSLTPTEQQLASTVLAMGERLLNYSIKEFAQAAHVSVPSVHRFCKKLGLEGFKELKVEVARTSSQGAKRGKSVDINFPFVEGDSAHDILSSIALVYEATLRDTRAVLDVDAVERTADLIHRAHIIDIYTQSHNLYPASMFRDRLLSIGKTATCFESVEQVTRTALASDKSHVAITISYSGMAPFLSETLAILKIRKVPTVLIGTSHAERQNPGLTEYLHVDDSESLQNRITQFASHIAVQYVLDTLFGCVFVRDAERYRAFLKKALPYTSLPALRTKDPISPEMYLSRIMSELK